MDLNTKEHTLLNLLMELPPSMDAAKEYLHTEHLTADEVTRVAIEYADACFLDAGDLACEQHMPDAL